MVHRHLLSRSVAAAVLLLLLLLPLSAIATEFEYCGAYLVTYDTADYSVKVNSSQISQTPVVSGWETTFNISANTRDEISAGSLELFIVSGGRRYGDVHDICDLITCPVPVGDFTLLFKEVLAGGYYAVAPQLYGPDGDLLTCFLIRQDDVSA